MGLIAYYLCLALIIEGQKLHFISSLHKRLNSTISLLFTINTVDYKKQIP